ncbi:MAG: hypothetical protein WCZ27_04880 [Tissierellaceae bacterium]
MGYRKATKLSESQILILSEIKEIIINKDIPNSYPDFLVGNLDMHTYSLRNSFIKYMGFVLVSKLWIKDLSKWIGQRNCLEVMAGLGALSHGLREEGVSLISTDDYSWQEGIKRKDSTLTNNKLWTQVERLDAVESIEKYGKDIDIVLMSWPPYDDNTATRILEKMRSINPSCIMIYIGEGRGGSTANDDFFDLLEKVEDESFHKANTRFQKWSLTNDHPLLIK